jgi:hypothetical protein
MAGYTPARVAVLGSRHTGVGARECLASANRAERALVHRSGVDAAHDDLEANAPAAREETRIFLIFVPFFVKVQFAM